MNKTKFFISYSHKNEQYLDRFVKHIETSEVKNDIELWYDKFISPGQFDFLVDIDREIDCADFILLMLSVDYLSSKSCLEEKDKATSLHEAKGIRVIPIILSPCAWLDSTDLKRIIALPKDGTPIAMHDNEDYAWLSVVEAIKNELIFSKKIKQIKISDAFNDFLCDADILKKGNSKKECVYLDDIFIYPELDEYNDTADLENTIKLDKLLNDNTKYHKIAIAGSEQSGKTSLCKKAYLFYYNLGYFPVYIEGDKLGVSGKIKHRLKNAFIAQYQDVDAELYSSIQQKIVPIVDDFYLVKNMDEVITELDAYRYCLVIIDDIFNLNIKDEKLVANYVRFKIKELKPSLRNELIKKWLSLSDKKNLGDNDIYCEIDRLTEHIDSMLGRNIGQGIIPSYPFFLLSMIMTYDTLLLPLDQEITSQGYCYQAFIFLYLRRQGVRNDEINIYINFFSECSFFFYLKGVEQISSIEFDDFMIEYVKKYNLPIKKDILVRNIAHILSIDSLGYYYFRYRYIYYYFVAKYIADGLDKGLQKDVLVKIMANLHVNENAYIAIFLSHHTKSDFVLDEVLLNALCLFDQYKPISLSKNEVIFFDKKISDIIKGVLPATTDSPEKSRKKILEIKDDIEHDQAPNDVEIEIDDDSNLAVELRRAVKTVEVMGHVIKNRAGSLERKRLEEIFEYAMNIIFKICNSFFNLIREDDNQAEIIEYISGRLTTYIEKTGKKYDVRQLENISRRIFWNNNFFLTYDFFLKVVSSLGSNKLHEIIDSVCHKINTPAAFIVSKGVMMWYSKVVDIDSIAKRIEQGDFSEVAKKVIKFMVIDHCSMHSIRYDERQKISSKLEIPARIVDKGSRHK